MARQFGLLKHIKQILQLVKEGFNPVAVIVGGTVEVTADFRISDLLSKGDLAGYPLLVVPLHRELIDAYAEAEKELPQEPRYSPAQRVVVQDRGKQRQRTYEAASAWCFKINEK